MKLKDCNGKKIKKPMRDSWAEEVLTELLQGGDNWSFVLSGDSLVLGFVNDDGGEIEIFDVKVRRTANLPVDLSRRLIVEDAS